MFCCKGCGYKMKIAVIPVKRNATQHKPAAPHVADTADLEKVIKEHQQLKEQYSALENKYATLKKTYDQVCVKVCQLDDYLKKAQNSPASTKNDKELEDLRKFCDFQNGQIVRLRKENTDLESTVKFFKEENERRNLLKTRDIVDMFLEYMSGIYNASLDINDADALSEMIRARTDKVIMTAKGCGLNISRSERGSVFGTGRIDIDTKATDDKKLDGKVNKCRKFGCVFQNDSETEIPERICIWKYSPPVQGNTRSDGRSGAALSVDTAHKVSPITGLLPAVADVKSTECPSKV